MQPHACRQPKRQQSVRQHQIAEQLDPAVIQHNVYHPLPTLPTPPTFPAVFVASLQQVVDYRLCVVHQQMRVLFPLPAAPLTPLMNRVRDLGSFLRVICLLATNTQFTVCKCVHLCVRMCVSVSVEEGGGGRE